MGPERRPSAPSFCVNRWDASQPTIGSAVGVNRSRASVEEEKVTENEKTTGSEGEPAGPQKTEKVDAPARTEEQAPYAEINTAVRAALPTDAVLAGDSSQVTYFGSVHFFDMSAPWRFCYSPGYATFGADGPTPIHFDIR